MNPEGGGGQQAPGAKDKMLDAASYMNPGKLATEFGNEIAEKWLDEATKLFMTSGGGVVNEIAGDGGGGKSPESAPAEHH